jgi:WD40 repeat protein
MILKCSFGGFKNSLVAVGSEDCKVRIWHREKGELLGELKDHTAAINCVHMSPTDPNLLISCSDDMTVKVWGLEEL